jgi:ArsR family transcriptional regulator
VQEHLGLSQPATSYHMKVLRQAGLVSTEKRGRWVHYRISRDGVEALETFLAGLEESADAPSLTTT